MDSVRNESKNLTSAFADLAGFEIALVNCRRFETRTWSLSSFFPSGVVAVVKATFGRRFHSSCNEANDQLNQSELNSQFHIRRESE